MKFISSFVCEKDKDIEIFLKERAIMFDKLGKSRTFFVYDEDIPQFNILGYFTIGLQILSIPEYFSNRKIKELDGFNAKNKGEVISNLPVILIGQIAKNDIFKNIITGQELFEYCLNMIFDSQLIIGGRIILLECKNIPYLVEFYNKFRFVKFNKNNNENELLQFIRILKDYEI